MTNITEKILSIVIISGVAVTIFFTYPIYGIKVSIVTTILFVLLGILSARHLKKIDSNLTELFDGMSDDQIISELNKLNEQDYSEIINLMKRKPEKYLSILQKLK